MATSHPKASGSGRITTTVSTGTELIRFLVTGNWNSVEEPELAGSTNALSVNTITANVTFYPRVGTGFTAFIDNLDLQSFPETSGDVALSIAPITASIIDGVLVSNVIGDTPGVQLLSNFPELNLDDQGINRLYYDINFTNVVFNGVPQTLRNWSFYAPVDSTPVCLTSPTLNREPYSGPTQKTYNLA